jgi:hypothetical protein
MDIVTARRLHSGQLQLTTERLAMKMHRAAVALVLFSACGVSTSDSDDTSTETTETTEQAVTGSHTYTFSMPWFTINKTRAPVDDTDYVTEAVLVNGVTAWSTNFYAGSVDDGTHYTPSTSLPITVNPGDMVQFTANIDNHGHTYDLASYFADVLNAITSLAGSVVPGLGSKDLATEVKNFMEAAFGWIFPDCDGTVASPEVAFTGAQLAAAVQPVYGNTHPLWSQTIGSPGTDSPVGCGGNSYYYELLQIVQTDVNTTPPTCPAGQISCCGGDFCVARGHSCGVCP